MLTRLLRLLAPLTPRRRSRLFPIFRRGRFQTGLFRSRRPHPTPSPRPRTQRPWRRPSVPSQLQPSSPTRQKNRPKLSLASPNPLWGFGLARDSSPFTPTQFPPPGTRPQLRPTPATAGCRAGASRPASRPGLATSPWQDLAHPRPAALPCHTPVRPSPGVARRVPASPKKRPAAPQEFFGKNSYCARDPRLRRSGLHSSPAPASTPPPRPSTLAWTHQASEPV